MQGRAGGIIWRVCVTRIITEWTSWDGIGPIMNLMPEKESNGFLGPLQGSVGSMELLHLPHCCSREVHQSTVPGSLYVHLPRTSGPIAQLRERWQWPLVVFSGRGLRKRAVPGIGPCHCLHPGSIHPGLYLLMDQLYSQRPILPSNRSIDLDWRCSNISGSFDTTPLPVINSCHCLRVFNLFSPLPFPFATLSILS